MHQVVFQLQAMPMTLLQLAWYIHVPSPHGPDLLKPNHIVPVHDDVGLADEIKTKDEMR